jgi:hypothetical protein
MSLLIYWDSVWDSGSRAGGFGTWEDGGFKSERDEGLSWEVSDLMVEGTKELSGIFCLRS